MSNTSSSNSPHKERVIELASQSFRLIRLALYQNKTQLALDLTDALQTLPLDNSGPEYDQLIDRLQYVVNKYKHDEIFHGFAATWVTEP